MTDRPTLFFDDGGALTVFGPPHAVIRADAPEDVRPALAALEESRRAGNYLAGYISYEAGYALERALAPLLPGCRKVPLLWFAVCDGPTTADPAALDGWQRGRAYAGPLKPEWDETAYGRRFAAIQAGIAAGDFYQANLTLRARFAFAGDPLALYARLRAAAGARYAAFLDDGERQILCLSPELFFAAAPDGTVVTRPMKGTAPRGPDPAADRAWRDQLAASPKNRAENLMIVDLMRNDLGRLAAFGSVAVDDPFAIETYPTLHQMVTTVSARLKPGASAADVMAALFPCGSVTGAPKIAAMRAIAALESSPRGIYCGAVGHFSPDGAARFAVAIRTLTISGVGELGIGGGIVADSDAASEYGEALLKARYFETVRRPLGLIETFGGTPDGGFVRIERHLDRMARSAAAFGIGFDRDAALAALDGIARRQEPLCVRLTLDESGRFAAAAAPLGPPPSHWTSALSPVRVPSGDALARHKTDWRELYDRPHPGVDEILFVNQRGELCEGGRSTIFVARGGRLLTPPLSAGCLDGVLRRELLEQGRAVEAVLTADDLKGEFHLGNSLRGLVRATLIAPA